MGIESNQFLLDVAAIYKQCGFLQNTLGFHRRADQLLHATF